MKPPPPMLPALGCVTASAKAVATAASTALPPLASTPAPASQAGAEVQTTIPSFDWTPSAAGCRPPPPRLWWASMAGAGSTAKVIIAKNAAARILVMAAEYIGHRTCHRRICKMEIWPGEPFPLGATFDGSGTNFSLFSEAATGVTLCLFDENGVETHVNLPEVTALCWHGYLPGIKP